MLKIYFKHSSRCPISLRAKKEVRAFLENNLKNIDFEEINVLNNRERSLEIEKLFNIDHESPQIIICDKNNKVIWDGSHQEITEKKLIEIINN